MNASTLPPPQPREPAAATCVVCTVRDAVDSCPGPRRSPRSAREALAVCRRCHAAMRQSYPCPCMSLEDAKRIYAEEGA